MDDVAGLVEQENATLVAALERLDEEQWRTGSLCEGWTVREVAVHLLMPYRLTVAGFLGRMALARFDFDRLADRWARSDGRGHRAVVDDVRGIPRARFAVPGAPAEAPLSHLVIHAEDIARPLGLDRRPGTRAAEIVLEQMTTPRGRGLTPEGLRSGLTFVATDADWRHGEGPEVHAPASALITLLGGRHGALDDLDGPGADQARARSGHRR